MVERPNKITITTVLIGAVAGLVGFALFAFIGATLAGIAAGPLHISSMEGASGYFAVGIGLLCGVAGLIGTMFVVLRWRGLRGVNILLGGVAAVVTVFGLAAAAVGAWYSMQPHISNPNGPEPILRVEIRAPAAVGAQQVADLNAELNTDRNSADVILEEADASDPLMRHGYVPLYYRTSKRLLVVKAPNASVRLYNLHLAANAMSKKYRDWSAWQRPDFVDEAGRSGPKRAGGGPDLEIRYRVEVAGE